MNFAGLHDTYGRRHTQMRISVTDRCNIRCLYCMPAEVTRFLPRADLLTFEEIDRILRVCVARGVRKARLTGGEPLVRANLDRLVRLLHAIPGLEEIALTTNGMLLAEQAKGLKQAGLDRLNISLDALNPEVFQRLTRRTGVEQVVAGIDAAREVGFAKIRLNAVIIKDLNESEIQPLAEFARVRNLELRFIEFMPLDADQHWSRPELVSGEEIRRRIEQVYGRLQVIPREDPSQPAEDYQYADRPLRVGFIDSVTHPFCGDCNRLRLTAEGKLRNCLFSTEEWDLRGPLREGADEDRLAEVLRACVSAKKPGHGIDSPKFLRPQRAMYQIGG